MKIKNRTIHILFYLSFVFSAFTNAENKNFTAYGVGLISCEKYSNLLTNSLDQSMANQWVMGFITAKNESLYFQIESGSTTYLDDLEYKAIAKYVEKYCDENPLESIYSAANKLVYDLSLKK